MRVSVGREETGDQYPNAMVKTEDIYKRPGQDPQLPLRGVQQRMK